MYLKMRPGIPNLSSILWSRSDISCWSLTVYPRLLWKRKGATVLQQPSMFHVIVLLLIMLILLGTIRQAGLIHLQWFYFQHWDVPAVCCLIVSLLVAAWFSKVALLKQLLPVAAALRRHSIFPSSDRFHIMSWLILCPTGNKGARDVIFFSLFQSEQTWWTVKPFFSKFLSGGSANWADLELISL